MRKFFVPRTSVENVNVVQSKVEVEEPPLNLANEFNSNEIVQKFCIAGFNLNSNEIHPSYLTHVSLVLTGLWPLVYLNLNYIGNRVVLFLGLNNSVFEN
jgi:hypothetical protein